MWEAALFANAKNVDNLIAVIDYNGKQIDGPVDKVITLGDLAAKWKSFGWNVFEMDGHNPQEIEDTIQKAKPNVTQKQTINNYNENHYGKRSIIYGRRS